MMMNILSKFIEHIRIERNRRITLKEEACNMHLIKMQKLTSIEKKQIYEKWNRLGLSINPLYFRMFKTLEYFSPLWVADDLYFPYMTEKLNHKNARLAYEHKGNLTSIFGNDFLTPSTILNVIRGVVFDSNGNIVDHNVADSLLQKAHSYIIKPSIESSCGRSVRKCTFPEWNVSNINKYYSDNYIVQEIIEQHPFTAQFNKNSLNTFRISTLFINGNVSLCSVLFRCGQDGNVVDNGGAGGLMVGVEENGIFRDYAYNNRYERFNATKNGVIFKNLHFKGLPEIIERIKEIHIKNIPFMGFAGWDIAIDIQGNPVLIEVNLTFPGVQFEQLCASKPMFGDRTEEVIQYVSR